MYKQNSLHLQNKQTTRHKILIGILKSNRNTKYYQESLQTVENLKTKKCNSIITQIRTWTTS